MVKNIYDENTPVLIVGGGIVGLSAALFLEKQHIPFLLVERHSGTSIHPRARGVNGRTMELYREIGVDEAVREAGAALAPAMGILKGKTVAEALESFSADAARAAFAGMGNIKAILEASPTMSARITQDCLEPVLLDVARQRGGDLRFYSELVSFEQDEQGVTAIILDRSTGREYSVRAEYMIAADGANSPVRRQLGAAVSGRGTLGHLLNVLFNADLREFVRGRELSICLVENPQVTGLLTSINLSDVWVFHILYDPSKGETPEQFPPERVKELVRSGLGLPELEIEIKSILPWASAMNVADNFQHGRVFLAGDAAHQMPPWGGQGANSGIADAHNLAWKLAAVLNKKAAPSLLASYSAERHPVTYLAADESAAAADERGLMAMQSNRMAAFLDRIPRMWGYYTYAEPSQALLLEQGLEASSDPLGLDGRPGTRAPHVWVERQGARISMLDLFGSHFIVLAGSEGQPWCEAAREIATRLETTLEAYTVGAQQGSDLVDAENSWQGKAGIEPGGMLLVRPDGYIAWRSSSGENNAEGVLEDVMRSILSR